MSADRAALALAALAWLATACAHSGGTQGGGGAEPDAEVVALAGALAGLDAAVDAGEARLAAQTALAATREVAEVYRMTWPPQLHNALVNSGLRERGLCCHWAEDMAARLRALDLR
ncbi:MAG: hypothetical protein KC560_04050, partial [Myxococcales bacterium]|nr:hypothetical protein [Myxococcales bacterium]